MKYNKYFDNAATSWPKPDSVMNSMISFMKKEGGSYGRAHYPRALATARMVENCRDCLLELLGKGEIVFTKNATEAFNLAMSMIIGEKAGHFSLGRHLHNMVTRTVHHCSTLKTENFPSLQIENQMSNVSGEIFSFQKRNNHFLVVDAAQSLSFLELKWRGKKILDDLAQADMVVWTGHKGLMGPTGTGGLWINAETDIASLIGVPLLYGGTGTSESDSKMPMALPDRYEAGTLNTVGLVGLNAALAEREKIMEESLNWQTWIEFLREVKLLSNINEEWQVFAAENEQQQGHLFSFRLQDEDPGTTAIALSERYGIETRVGLHCAPQAHVELGTQNTGSVRVSLSVYHRERDLHYLLDCLRKLVRKN